MNSNQQLSPMPLSDSDSNSLRIMGGRRRRRGSSKRRGSKSRMGIMSQYQRQGRSQGLAQGQGQGQGQGQYGGSDSLAGDVAKFGYGITEGATKVTQGALEGAKDIFRQTGIRQPQSGGMTHRRRKMGKKSRKHRKRSHRRR